MGGSLLWNLYAKVYDALPAFFPPYREMLDKTLDAARREGGSGELRVLDAGCGTGNYAIAFARGGYRVAAMDMSPAMLARARNKAAAAGLPVAFCTASLQEPFPFEDAAFDILLNINALYMLPDPGYALSEFARVLKPGGLLVLSNLQKRPVMTEVLGEFRRTYGLGRLFLAVPPLLALGFFNWLISRQIERGEFFFWGPDDTRDALGRAGFDALSVETTYTTDANVFVVARRRPQGAGNADEGTPRSAENGRTPAMA